VTEKREGKEESVDPIKKRLDALIRLLVEINKPKGKEKFNEAVAARLLRSVDLTPTEIAKILGKKSRTEIAPYLYSKTQPKAKGKRGGIQERKPVNQITNANPENPTKR
jgi:hypothetical protein